MNYLEQITLVIGQFSDQVIFGCCHYNEFHLSSKLAFFQTNVVVVMIHRQKDVPFSSV